MHHMPRTLQAALAAGFLWLPVTATGREPRKPLADLSVWEVASTRSSGLVLRAVKGYAEIYPFLVVEVIQPGEDEADEPLLVGSWALKDMAGWKVEAAHEGDGIAGLRWRGAELEFRYSQAAGSMACRVSGIVAKKPAVRCRPGAAGAKG